MKLKANYEKRASGQIRARLTVLDGRDYPSRFIFTDKNDWPSARGFSLFISEENAIEDVQPTPYDARCWVAEQVDSLQKELERWREIEVLRNEEFEI